MDMWEKQEAVPQVSPKPGKSGKDQDSEVAEKKFCQILTCR